MFLDQQIAEIRPHLILGGAALQRCGNSIVLDSDSQAAERLRFRISADEVSYQGIALAMPQVR
jgi:hypothetical protein